MPQVFGAQQTDWDHLAFTLGLLKDLLPVVSDPGVKISAESTMKSTGKTPSIVNRKGFAAGLVDWTSRVTTSEDIRVWGKDSRLGICLQTRRARAIDIDSTDPAEVQSILEMIASELGGLQLPVRTRSNSPKCLLLFVMPDELTKRVIRTPNGIIELLATGQQFIAVGTHTSGVPYEWPYGLPEDIPVLSLDQVNQIWDLLAERFGAISPGNTTAAPSRQVKLAAAIENDEVAVYLRDNGWVKKAERDGRLHIRCPWEEEHTGESAISSTSYFPPNTGGYQLGHFACLHAHCEHRTDEDFKQKLGLATDPFADFADLPVEQSDTPEGELPKEKKAESKFGIVSALEFSKRPAPRWIIKDVLPDADVVVIFGESGSGKSFLALDMSMAVARGVNWRNNRTRKGKAAYICAEGAGGFRNRLLAYAYHNEIDLRAIPIGVIPDAPNFMLATDIKAVIQSVKNYAGKDEIALIVVDTFAQVMPGANENAGEDVGKALAHCKVLHKHTGATVVLIHHAGKDSAKGARGWSGLRAAADTEIEVLRVDDHQRAAKITKQKDGQDGAEFLFSLNTVTVDFDEDGDVVTSCVVEYQDGKMPSRASKKGKKTVVDAVEQIALRALEERIGLTGEAVGVLDLREILIEHIPRTSTKADNRLSAADKAINTLWAAGRIVIDGMFISLPVSP